METDSEKERDKQGNIKWTNGQSDYRADIQLSPRRKSEERFFFIKLKKVLPLKTPQILGVLSLAVTLWFLLKSH